MLRLRLERVTLSASEGSGGAENAGYKFVDSKSTQMLRLRLSMTVCSVAIPQAMYASAD